MSFQTTKHLYPAFVESGAFGRFQTRIQSDAQTILDMAGIDHVRTPEREDAALCRAARDHARDVVEDGQDEYSATIDALCSSFGEGVAGIIAEYSSNVPSEMMEGSYVANCLHPECHPCLPFPVAQEIEHFCRGVLRESEPAEPEPDEPPHLFPMDPSKCWMYEPRARVKYGDCGSPEFPLRVAAHACEQQRWQCMDSLMSKVMLCHTHERKQAFLERAALARAQLPRCPDRTAAIETSGIPVIPGILRLIVEYTDQLSSSEVRQKNIDTPGWFHLREYVDVVSVESLQLQKCPHPLCRG